MYSTIVLYRSIQLLHADTALYVDCTVESHTVCTSVDSICTMSHCQCVTVCHTVLSSVQYSAVV